MSYHIQLETETTQGRFNIPQWITQFITSIDASDMKGAYTRAELFLTKDRTSDLETKARIDEITLNHTLEEASTRLLNALFEAIVMIKPQIVTRAGKDAILSGAQPIQAIATKIGLALHRDQVDAVQTGINVLSEFADMGIYDVRVTKEADRAQNRGGVIEVHGDAVIITPTMGIPIELYKRIQFTRYLPPMLVQPNDI